MEWYNPEICMPIDGSVVEVLGKPTFCCELDADEEGIYICKYKRKFESCKSDLTEFKFRDHFDVMDDPEERFILEIKGWRPCSTT